MKDSDYGEEGARPSALIPVHKLSTPDPLYDLQLLRELAIANERTRSELGPVQPGEMAPAPKRKPNIPAIAKRSDQSRTGSESMCPAPNTAYAAPVDDSIKDESMKMKHVAMLTAMGAVIVGDRAAAYATEPVWPNNGIAERELGDGEHSRADSMFVEHVDGKWIVWVLMSPIHGTTKALDFFSGKVIDATVEDWNNYNDSFVDSEGTTHKRATYPNFEFKDPRPGGGVGEIDFGSTSIHFDDSAKCAAFYLRAARRTTDRGKTVVWRKVPLYRDIPATSWCPAGVWDSLINTALDLRDGTMLMTAGKYIFRVHQKDLTPVGAAPNLYVVDEDALKKAIDKASDKQNEDISAYLTEELDLK